MQPGVQVGRAHRALVHRRKDLNVIKGIKPETARDVVSHQIDDDVGHPLGVVLPHEIKIGKAFPGGFQTRQLAPVDQVGVADDFAFRRLPEDVYKRQAAGSASTAAVSAR